MARILVIDDEPMICDMLRATLEAAGHVVAVAADGQEGLKLCASDPADVVITDIIMPEKEGLETILELRRTSPQARIIAMSGGSRMLKGDYLAMAERFGAAYTFTKPIDRKTLLEAIDELLKEEAMAR